ncbi:UDP-3-O-(3-hydroxymyristoyl)glucosamine N-acyltransferase [Aphanothece hegewaldii CCALA 016]|uniref:UDP-3-O-acylglucosamine N-acyltransferase n=1 Tax=Aphanothece hegewaldii CCALA 016 TaxID=2107694 RepID=A0A2T1LYM2_9CHRO|nr:UDP-3-O-(3-hydroxymyristoyl)glucosamine N-acyltransferase [Aphanothece hegewaldii]PSF37497.1 UDP-3-O-(3-hydroxymyristoyl)glucosamine N-acyltransferase [Aphanothece hegewaldii CCALA 016]
MQFTEIIHQLNPLIKCHSLTASPDCNPDINGVAAVDEAEKGTLSYIEGAKFAHQIEKTQASALILPLDEALQAQATQKGIAWLAASEPRLAFAHAINLFYKPFKPSPHIHPSAVIDPSATIGKDVYLGAHVVIQANVKIADGVCIHPNVVVYPDVIIGDRTILHANCTIHERTQIGSNCVVHSGAVLGAEGFGFVPSPGGWYKMEQSGYTVLEDGVEIGCNTTIDRPAVGETRIKRNTKIDNLVQIGHGCQIGENCAIAGQAGMAGGVIIGNNVILAGQVGIANNAKIGDNAIATAQTGIHNDINSGEIVSGSPAMPYKHFLKVAAAYKRLPEIYQAIKQLKSQ